ncbi:MAG: hypothetical protein GY839_19495 [candidate division Zixibacteria bacterium]|nr:hypothetical protein [candidate division Zixibacteria bacterium]
MNIIWIYGGVGVGKLTTANELSLLTNYPSFHNHLVIDLLLQITQEKNEQFWEACRKIRLSIFDSLSNDLKVEAIIYTAFEGYYGQSDKFVERVRKVLAPRGGQIFFTHLYCSKEENLRRVLLPDRALYNKINDIDTYSEITEGYDYSIPFPSRIGISIDNTNMPASRVAQMILENIKT